MRQPSVEFDGESVLLVVRVPVDGSPFDHHADLVPGSRQAVGPLDVPQVAVFEHRVDPVPGRRENVFERGSPAHFLAQLQRFCEPFLGGEPPADRLGYPAAGVVDGIG